MPNQKWEVYKNHETGILFDLTDADAQGKLTAILDGTNIDSFADVESALSGKEDTLTFDNAPTDGSSNPVKSDGVYDALQEKVSWDEQAVLGAKNLWEVKLSELKALNQAGTWTGNTYEKQGVTYTFTTIGDYVTEIILNGTASQDWVTFAIPAKTFKAGSYILSGSNGGEVASYRITASATGISDIINYDGDTAFSLSADTSLSANVTVRTKDYVANNVVFKLMIRLSTDTDSTYAPYAMTNRELTEKVNVTATNIKTALSAIVDETVENATLYYNGVFVMLMFRITGISEAVSKNYDLASILPHAPSLYVYGNINSQSGSGGNCWIDPNTKTLKLRITAPSSSSYYDVNISYMVN